MSLLVFLAACGGSGDLNPDPTDKTPPELTASIPGGDASNVPINVNLALTFSEAMARSALELTSNPPIALGAATWSDDDASVVFANDNLAASTPYTLTLKAKDVAGNALASTTIAFTTSTTAGTTVPSTPTGLVATPADGQVTLTWQANPEEDIAGYTVYFGTAEDALEADAFVTESTKTLTSLTNGTTYFFAVDALDAANNHSSRTTPVAATPSAETDTTPPTLQTSDPEDGASDASPRNPAIKLVFSEPMNTTDFAFKVAPPFVAPDALPDEPLELTWSDDDATLTLRPTLSELLPENTLFTLTLESAEDRAGNALAGDKDIAFTTGFEAPTLVSSAPANGATDVPVSERLIVTLTFSEVVDPETFQYDNNFPYGCEDPFWETGNLTVSFECTLQDEHTYTVFYRGQDSDGHPFEGSISFSTVADAAPPSVRSSFPEDRATGVPLGTLIQVFFDDEMDEASTLAAVSSSAPLGCVWELNEAKDTLRCSPANLQANTTYTVTVAETAQDTSGKNLVGSGLCRGEPPCSYDFEFSTITTAATGELRVNISGLPAGQNRVRVTGPLGFDSGGFDSSSTFTDLAPGDYTVTAAGFVLAPGKPACRLYSPDPATQQVTVTAGQTAAADIAYTFESCAP